MKTIEVLQRLNNGQIIPAIGYKFKHDTALDVCLVKSLNNDLEETGNWKVMDIRSGAFFCASGYGSTSKQKAIDMFMDIWNAVKLKDGLTVINRLILDGHLPY